MSVGACLECDDDLAHCHATWIRHPDGHEECVVLACRMGPESHAIVILCDEIDPACCAGLPASR